MKRLLTIILLFIIPFIGLTQTDPIPPQDMPKISDKKQLDLDMEIFGVSFGYKKRIYRNLFAGVKLGFGFTITCVNFGNDHTEELFDTYNFQFLIQYSIFNLLYLDIGPRFSSSFRGLDTENRKRLVLATGAFIRIRSVQYGLRLDFFSSSPNYGRFKETFSNSLLIVRIPLKHWK